MTGQDISSGWSITVGELRKALAGIPDDYELMVENAEVGDIEIGDLHLTKIYPPTPFGSPGLVIVSGGQVLNAEYDYHNRMDAHHELGGELRWDQAQERWRQV